MNAVITTTAFEDTVDILKGLVSKFTATTGTDWEDNYSTAISAWWQAYQTHRAESGGFIAWMKLIVWRQMQEQQRRECMRNARLKRNRGIEMETVACNDVPTWNREEFLRALSEDAQAVVRMVLEVDKDLDVAVLERGGVSPVNVRRALREVFRDIGWTAQRLRNAITEIKRSL